jgi:hypothetical protein
MPRPVLKMKPRTCQCGETFKPVRPSHRFCSKRCYEKAHRVECRTACLHCGGTMEATNARVKYCSGRCKKAAFVARHSGDGDMRLDPDGEAVVVDLESAPRRLRVAKMFDLFREGTCEFDHFTPAQWITPADKRAGR